MIFKLPLFTTALCAFLAGLSRAPADIQMPAIFGDHMVLQRDMRTPVWGKADPWETVSVSIGSRHAQTVADESGKWRVALEPMAVSAEPLEMKVQGKNTLVFQDVLIGDVWICSGQSNMEWSLAKSDGGSQALARADYPEIRFFELANRVTFTPQDDCEGKWVVCSAGSKELAAFSGVAFFFGREIFESQGVPMGLIGSYRGGTPAQAWMSFEALDSVPALKHFADDYIQKKENLPQAIETYKDETLPAWTRAVKQWREEPAPKGPKPRWPIPPNNNPKAPTVLFNGMINPLVPYGIKGVIWYQGENNANQPEEYAALFPALITSWRELWGQGSFPFIYVQLASYEAKTDKYSWPVVRNAQLETLKVSNVGMVVTIDIGAKNTAHPRDKENVGKRLALAARHLAYEEDLIYSGPLYRSMHIEGDRAVVEFDHVGSGLMTDSPGTPLQAFEIAAADGVFVPAEAVINDDTVVVVAPSVEEPVFVRYAWANWPNPAPNLYNREGLPASPFNTAYPCGDCVRKN
jgi:sialate O-acetylesterase